MAASPTASKAPEVTEAQSRREVRISTTEAVVVAWRRTDLRVSDSLELARAVRRSSSTARPRAARTSTIASRSPWSLSLGADILQAGIALALEEIAEDHPARRLAVVEGLHRQRIGEDSWRFELLAGIRDAHPLARLVHLHPPRTGQPHHPDMAGAGGEELLDLDLQIRFVLACVGVLDRQGRCSLGPSRLVGDLADGEIGGAEDFRGRGKTDVDANVLDRGIAREHSVSHARRLSSPAARGQAFNGMAVGQLIGVAGAKLVSTERALRSGVQRVFRHRASIAPGPRLSIKGTPGLRLLTRRERAPGARQGAWLLPDPGGGGRSPG